MKCIIIDDEAMARAIITQLCHNEESLVLLEEFSNAIQAIKYLNMNEVDMIFLDIHMPDFTGFDFIGSEPFPHGAIKIKTDSISHISKH